MKKNSIYTLLVVFLTAFSMTSCLKDQEDLFDDSASKRLTTYFAEAKDVLVSAEHGWAFNYFPDREQSYGGYIYILNFDQENVTVTSELDEESFTSTYKLTNESGPCLMVDTYNESIHKFSTPSLNLYEAYDGDNMFLILGVSDDKNTIALKGTRSGNILYMNRLEEDGKTYIESAMKMADNMLFNAWSDFITRDGKTVVALDLENRQFEITNKETGEYATTAFTFNKTGGVLYSALEFDGREISSFAFDSVNILFSLDGYNEPLVERVKTPAETIVSKTWYFSYNNLCDSLQTEWLKANNALKDAFGIEVDNCYFKNGVFDVIFGGNYHCMYSATLKTQGEDIVSFKIHGPHAQDVNVDFVEENVPEFKAFAATCNGAAFKISILDELGTVAKFTKVDNPSVYFTVTTSEVTAF